MAPSSSEIIYFTGENCRICKLMTPLVTEVAQEFDGSVILTRVDTSKTASRATEYNVMAVPTLVVVADGVEIGRSVGAQTPGTVKRLFRSASSGEPTKSAMDPRDRLLRLGFAFALGVLAVSTGQILVWPLVGVALIAAFWDKK